MCLSRRPAGWSPSSAASNPLYCSMLMFSSATSSSAAVSLSTRGLCHHHGHQHTISRRSCKRKENDAREQKLRSEPRRRLQRLKVILLIRRVLVYGKQLRCARPPINVAISPGPSSTGSEQAHRVNLEINPSTRI